MTEPNLHPQVWDRMLTLLLSVMVKVLSLDVCEELPS